METSKIILSDNSSISGSLQLVNDNVIIGVHLDNDSGLTYKIFRSASSTIDTLYITSSGNDVKIGIGTTDPKSFLDVKGNTGTEPADIVLRTAKPSDGKIATNDESGRISFVIESSSFTVGKSKAQFISSGSSAEIFSRIIGETNGAAYGNLIVL